MQQFLLELWEQTKTSILMITHDVREAVFLSQRIYVMTARPGTVQKEIAVDLGRSRTAQTRELPEFKTYQDDVMAQLMM